MISEVALKDGNKGLDALAGKATTGIPLGTWASFEKDYAPNPEWLEAGTDFDANAFPALAMYLGGTKVPERYDHSRLNPPINVLDTWVNNRSSTNVATFTAPYDGFLMFSQQTNVHSRVINWGLFQSSDNGATYNKVTHIYNPNDIGIPATIPIKKGWIYYGLHYENPSTNWDVALAEYYTHPMFIKATPTSSNSDYQGTLQAVMQYIRNMNSYSTEEKWTGGYWLDGKKIYRKCCPYANTITISNLEQMVNIQPIYASGEVWCGLYYYNSSNRDSVIVNGDTITPHRAGNTGAISYYIFEYTKTTDN